MKGKWEELKIEHGGPGSHWDRCFTIKCLSDGGCYIYFKDNKIRIGYQEKRKTFDIYFDVRDEKLMDVHSSSEGGHSLDKVLWKRVERMLNKYLRLLPPDMEERVSFFYEELARYSSKVKAEINWR